MLEDALRDMFAERADATPIAAAPAATAIASGRARARRRSVTSGLGLALVLFVIAAGGLTISDMWVRPPTPEGSKQSAAGSSYVQFGQPLSVAELNSTPMELSLDIRIGNRMLSAAGNWYVLDGIDDVETVIRVPAGWLYADATDLRLLRTDGTSIPLLTHISTWIVSPTGDRIAALAARTLRTFSLTTHGLGPATSVTVPIGVSPVAFLGALIAVRQADTGRFDYWDPADTSFKPTWSATLSRVLDSSVPDTFAIVGDTRLCLIRVLAAKGLHADSAIGCGNSLEGALNRATVSPDGRLLAVPTSRGLNIIDLAHATAHTSTATAGEPVVASTCMADSGTVPIWSALDTVISTSSGTLIACSVNGPRRAVALPETISPSWQLVPIRA